MPTPGIKSVREKMDGTRSGSINRLWQRHYVRTFVVETYGPEVGPLQVRSAIDPVTGGHVPYIGQFYHNGLAVGDPNYEYDAGSFIDTIEASCDQDGSGLQWTVTLNYAPYDMNTFGNDPSLWPIKVSFGGERTEKVVYFDKDGNPVRNSAGDPFDPPITIDDSRSTMTVTRNELVAAFDLTLAETFRDTINKAAWNGFDVHTVKLGIITTSEPQYDSNAQIYYYTVTYPFMIDRKGWRKVILDSGCNEIDATTGKTKAIMNQGQQVSDPVPLDGSGHRLAVGAAPVSLTLDCYDESDFDLLNIDLATRLGAPPPGP
jgi:hypothetical protein